MLFAGEVGCFDSAGAAHPSPASESMGTVVSES